MIYRVLILKQFEFDKQKYCQLPLFSTQLTNKSCIYWGWNGNNYPNYWHEVFQTITLIFPFLEFSQFLSCDYYVHIESSRSFKGSTTILNRSLLKI